jgi:hypothetical protein
MLLMKEFRMTNFAAYSSLDQPSLYQIRVQGILDPSWSARLEGLNIEVEQCAGDLPVTLLTGLLQDQAALNGVLTTLYGLGFTLRSVTTL